MFSFPAQRCLLHCLSHYVTSSSQSCPILCDPQSARLLCLWNSPGRNTGVGCQFLLQGIFPTQGSNPGLPHCGQTLYCLSYRALSPANMMNMKCPWAQVFQSLPKVTTRWQHFFLLHCWVFCCLFLVSIFCSSRVDFRCVVLSLQELGLVMHERMSILFRVLFLYWFSRCVQ